MNNNDSATFLGKKGKIMQNAEVQIGTYDENIFPEEKEIEPEEIIDLKNEEYKNNENNSEINEYEDELNNIDPDNIIPNDEEDLNQIEIENELNEKEELNNENNNNNINQNIEEENNVNSMNFSQLNLIKSHLKLICDKIEEGLNNYHKSKEISKDKNDTSFQNSFSNIEIKPLTKEINNYKQQSENIQYELEHVYNIQKVNELESELQKKKNFCEKLKKDNLTLRRVIKDQSKGIDEYISKFDNSKEIDEIKEQLKIEKGELKIKKDENKIIENKIKNQNSKIDVLEKKSKLIKENIEYCKKKQMKDKKNQIEEEKDEKIDENDIEKLIEEKNKLSEENSIKEKLYKNEIKNQQIKIKEMRSQISKISNILKSIEQMKKKEELKKREIQRNKLRQNQKSKSPIRINPNQKSKSPIRINNNNQNNIIINQKKYDRVKNMSRDNIRRFNDNNYNNNKSNIIPNFGNKNSYNNQIIDDLILTRTPNLKVKGGKFNKPFEINKFNKGQNITNYIPKRLSQALPENPSDIFKRKGDIHEVGNEYNNMDINIKSNINNNEKGNKNPDIVVNEIENLKNEIQNALKNNIFQDNPLSDKNIYSNDIDNENINININSQNRVNSNEKNYKFNEQSTILATPINDISDIKNEFDYLNELDNQNIISKNLPKERPASSKRKPFNKNILKPSNK